MKARGAIVGVTALALVGGLCLSASAAAAPTAKAKAKKPAAAKTACTPEKAALAQKSKTSILRRLMEKMERATRGDGFANEGDRWNEWFYGQRKYPATTLPPDAIGKALRAAKRNNTPKLQTGTASAGAAGKSKATAALVVPSWVALGPSQIPGGQTDTSLGGGPNPFAAGTVSGRVSAIAVDPTDPNTVYCGGAQGGVWKTTNALAPSPTWTPISDFEASLAIGDIAIDPVDHNIIYVGTGEANGSCDSYFGQGILRSTDGGSTWTLLNGGGFFTSEAISRIVIDPATAGSATSTTLWASTVLGFFASGTEDCNIPPGAYNGALFRSTDSGATWQVQDVPTGAAGSARIHDMALDPADSNVLYVAVRGFPEATGGIWRSNNALDVHPKFNKVDTKFANTLLASPPIRRITADAPPGEDALRGTQRLGLHPLGLLQVHERRRHLGARRRRQERTGQGAGHHRHPEERPVVHVVHGGPPHRPRQPVLAARHLGDEPRHAQAQCHDGWGDDADDLVRGVVSALLRGSVLL